MFGNKSEKVGRILKYCEKNRNFGKSTNARKNLNMLGNV